MTAEITTAFHSQFIAIVTEKTYTHGTCCRNRRHKSTPFSGIGFRRPFFVWYTTGIKISGVEETWLKATYG